MKNKGCVYFFRHIGLTPVKIGYSSNQSPLKRFEQFQTYAPYGAEIVGFIEIDNPDKLEKKLHLKYSGKKLNGEWFDITEQDIENEIILNDLNNKSQEKYAFNLAWAKELQKNEEKIKESIYIEDTFLIDNTEFISTIDIVKILNTKYNETLSVQIVSVQLKFMGFEKTSKRINGIHVRGFYIKLIK